MDFNEDIQLFKLYICIYIKEVFVQKNMTEVKVECQGDLNDDGAEEVKDNSTPGSL
jgi:hypothetical protein